MLTAGLWRYGDWRHVATGCNALVTSMLRHKSGGIRGLCEAGVRASLRVCRSVL